MRPRPGTARRRPVGSPFADPVAVPLQQFAIDDRVTHDRFGLGTVYAVEEGLAVLVDFGSRRERIPAPYAKLSKL